ncbi:MAG: hypothetical protein GXP32_05880 [Kiritimatiellaeota bacterium]|nr:hypothetical protein [Kiritimatiellota bacterium]
MNRIIKIAIDDIIINPSAQSQLLTKAAAERTPNIRVTGICEINDVLLITCEERGNGEEAVEYIFAPFESVNEDDVVAEIRDRYFSNFTFLGGFDVKKVKWALFAHNPDRETH